MKNMTESILAPNAWSTYVQYSEKNTSSVKYEKAARTKYCGSKTPQASRNVSGKNAFAVSEKAARVKREIRKFESNDTRATAYGPHEHVKNSCLQLTSDDDLDNSKLAKRVTCHAYTRVQLFYYLLVAYFKEKCQIKLAKTELQYGSSQCPGCSAAHSSLIPNVVDNFFQRLAKKIAEKGVTKRTRAVLEVLGVPNQKINKLSHHANPNRSTLPTILDKCGWHNTQKLFSQNNHFYRSLNATIELPRFVNECDQLIENNFRAVALEILNKCSMGLLTPKKALKMFVERLKKFLRTCQSCAEQRIEIVQEIASLQGRIKHLESDFGDLDKPASSLREYIEAIAKLSFLNRKWEIYKSHTISLSLPGSIICRNELFDRILSKVMLPQAYMEVHKDFNKLKIFARTLYESFQKNPLYEEQVELLHLALQKKSYNSLYRAVKQFCEQSDPLDLLFLDKSKIAQICNQIKQAINEKDDWQPSNMEKTIHRLQEFIRVYEWQSEGCQVPQIWTDQWAEKTSHELGDLWFEQKLEVIKRPTRAKHPQAEMPLAVAPNEQV